MKRVLLGALLAISSCFASHLRITELIPELNVIVLEDAYVVKVDRMIPTMHIGSRLEFSVENFHNYEAWDQDIPITRRVHVGTDVRIKTTSNKSEYERMFSDDVSDEQKMHTREEVQRYENVTTIERFRFTPIGFLQGYKLNLIDFELFINSQAAIPPLATYYSRDLDHGYIYTHFHLPQLTNFAGEGETLWWVLDHLKTYGDNYTCTIRPIFHKRDINLVVGALTHAVSYGWMMRDFEAFGLARLEDPYLY